MNRRELAAALRKREWAAAELARHFRVPVGEIVEDLQHIRKSLRHSAETITVEPALCLSCGFRCSSEKLNKPSRCPDCKASRLRDPLVEIRGET